MDLSKRIWIGRLTVQTLLPPDVEVVFPSGETVPGYAEGHNFVYALRAGRVPG